MEKVDFRFTVKILRIFDSFKIFVFNIYSIVYNIYLIDNLVT